MIGQPSSKVPVGADLLRGSSCSPGSVLPGMCEDQAFGIFMLQREMHTGGREMVKIKLWIRVAIAR